MASSTNRKAPMPLFQASGLLLSLNLSELIDYLVQFLCGIGICFSKGIELVDHIIIADDDYVSMAASGFAIK